MKEPEPLPITIEELEAANEVSDEDMRTMRALVAQHVILGKEERAAADAKKPLTERIKAIVQKTPALHKVLCAGGVVNFYPADRSSIKADKLLAQGISPEVIAKATVTTTVWTLKIRDVADIEGE